MPPADIMVGCDKLKLLTSSDKRDVLKVETINTNLYFVCASKLNSAILYINLTK